MFFTHRCQVYKTLPQRVRDSKALVLGDHGGEAGHGRGRERGIYGAAGIYSGHLLFFFENGNIARVEMKAYATVLPLEATGPTPSRASWWPFCC